MPKSFVTPCRSALKTALIFAGLLSMSVAFADPLKVCSDPDNMPFSKSEGSDKGLYIELAEMVGERLGTSIEYVWWLTHNQRRAVRNTMDSCDAYFALPATADYKVRGAEKTHAFLDVGYAIVGPASFELNALEDLKGKRVGVMHGSPPHVLLSSETGYEPRNFRTQEDVFAALASGEVELAILWGPSAGFENQSTMNSRWKITPVAGQGLNGQIAVAVSKNKPELKEKINQALTELQPEIKKLQQKYGFPQATPVMLDAKASWLNTTNQVAGGAAPAGKAKVVAVKEQAKLSHAKAEFAELRPFMRKVADSEIDNAKSNFNSRCSHCHGQNGASPQQERDLRKLKIRYADKWQEVALTTITKGRPELGMPTWGGTISDDDIKHIINFLTTIQK
ncbi:MAG: transporter substrate-binding domain-containing protein [Oxalobacteraceae bacterium]|jgi:polar amino acid transport system substrate-binding protein|nr:transporter substrate-binding domain-containing protein [Oxalobacteraceae bacterium]